MSHIIIGKDTIIYLKSILKFGFLTKKHYICTVF